MNYSKIVSRQEKERPQNIERGVDLDAEASLKFLEEYRALCRKWKRDFVQGEIHIVKVDFVEQIK